MVEARYLFPEPSGGHRLGATVIPFPVDRPTRSQGSPVPRSTNGVVLSLFGQALPA